MFSINSNNNDGSPTIIGEKVKIKGRFDFKGMVVIDGSISGKIKSDGVIKISKTGVVESSIKVKGAEIAGKFMGEMTTTGPVKIKSGGRFEGKLTQKNGANLIIEKGGVLKGRSLAPDYKEEVILN